VCSQFLFKGPGFHCNQWNFSSRNRKSCESRYPVKNVFMLVFLCFVFFLCVCGKCTIGVKRHSHGNLATKTTFCFVVLSISMNCVFLCDRVIDTTMLIFVCVCVCVCVSVCVCVCVCVCVRGLRHSLPNAGWLRIPVSQARCHRRSAR